MNTERKKSVSIWPRLLAVLTFPGDFLISRLPKMDDEMTRLTVHMTNYIFWLTPSIGIAVWLVIRHAIASV